MRLACLIVLAAAVAAPAATARPSYGGNACSLLAGKQVATFGIASSCKPLTVHSSGFATSYATWGASTKPHLALTIDTFASSSNFLFKLKLQQMKALGKKVSGIGSVAYERFQPGSALVVIDFVVGKQFVTISLISKAPLASPGAANAVAKTIAARL